MNSSPTMGGRDQDADRPLSYQESRELARHPDVAERQRLAARTDVRAEILYYLAEDPSALVRREIAVNEKTPAHADVLLARDGDEAVRCELARKIARLTPDLSVDAREQIRTLTVESLEILARRSNPFPRSTSELPGRCSRLRFRRSPRKPSPDTHSRQAGRTLLRSG